MRADPVGLTRAVALVVNPSAGGGRAARALPLVQERLRALGLDVETAATRDLAHARELAAEAARNGRVVAALGGDGLLGCVAGALREIPGAAMGVLPGGRGNDFARMAGIPLDAAQACDVIANGSPRPIDLGAAGDRTFIGIASLGFDSDANRIANDAKMVRGNVVYLYAALRALLGWKHARFTVTVDGERHEVTGWTVAVANSKAYGGGMYAAPQAELDDGRLDVVTSARTSRRYLLFRTLPRVFKGAHLELPNISTYRGEEITVDSDRPFDIYADGDPIGRTPATIRVAERVLRVIAPAAG
jgi:YegS/Rv2252/BmrU family lipid kinase